ncbi:MAG TPA: RIP metalloprotease RseP [Longimicrobiales bacterium]|nr:RIP metalloprotease RseP [Longimicrobiales bacterium]
MLITLLATVIVLGVLILVHELGHFVTAKLADIEVPRFSIGLGPKLWGFRIGETEYVLSWVPLGGYVKMAGMEEMDAVEGGEEDSRLPKEVAGVGTTDVGLLSDEGEHTRVGAPGPRDFDGKSVGTRAIVLSAGVIMNLLFAFFLYSVIAGLYGVEPRVPARLGSVLEERIPEGGQPLTEVPSGARILRIGERAVDEWRDVQDALTITSAGPTTFHFEEIGPVTVDLPADDSLRAVFIFSLRPAVDPVIGRIVEGMPGDRAGLRPGDRIVRAGGEPIHTFDDLVAVIQGSPEASLPLVVERDGRSVQLTVTPAAQTVPGPGGGQRTVGQIGVGTPRERPGPLGAVAYGARETWRWSSFTVEILGELFTGGVSARSVGGPILIGQLSGRFARAGVEAFLGFMALVSINLAIFNLLPIPVLDGGHLVFLAVEAVRGRALSLEQRMRFTQVGMALLLMLIVWVVANDVLRLLGI